MAEVGNPGKGVLSVFPQELRNPHPTYLASQIHHHLTAFPKVSSVINLFHTHLLLLYHLVLIDWWEFDIFMVFSFTFSFYCIYSARNFEELSIHEVMGTLAWCRQSPCPFVASSLRSARGRGLMPGGSLPGLTVKDPVPEQKMKQLDKFLCVHVIPATWRR